MQLTLSAVVSAAAVLLASAQDTCQRGYFQYASMVDSMGDWYTTDFKVCEGRKWATSDAYEWGKWYACSTDADNTTDLTEYVYERYFDSFKCNDGNRLNETKVGAIGDLSDANWVANMYSMYGASFMLYEEDMTYCDAFGTVQCTIETNTISRVDTSDSSWSCSGVEVYRTKSQMPTRVCYAGSVYNCTGDDDSYTWTVYDNMNCTGLSNQYEYTDGGCQRRVVSRVGRVVTFDDNAEDEVRVLQCHACAPFATALAFVAAVAAAFWQ